MEHEVLEIKPEDFGKELNRLLKEGYRLRCKYLGLKKIYEVVCYKLPVS